MGDDKFAAACTVGNIEYLSRNIGNFSVRSAIKFSGNCPDSIDFILKRFGGEELEPLDLLLNTSSEQVADIFIAYNLSHPPRERRLTRINNLEVFLKYCKARQQMGGFRVHSHAILDLYNLPVNDQAVMYFVSLMNDETYLSHVFGKLRHLPCAKVNRLILKYSLNKGHLVQYLSKRGNRLVLKYDLPSISLICPEILIELLGGLSAVI